MEGISSASRDVGFVVSKHTRDTLVAREAGVRLDRIRAGSATRQQGIALEKEPLARRLD